MKLKILFLPLLVSLNAFGQRYSNTDFVELKKSNMDSIKKLLPENRPVREFSVTTKNNDIEIVALAKEKSEVTLEVENGSLIGIDHGEWGGKIEFLNKVTGQRALIKEGNVKFIFRYQGKTYFLEGLAHLSTNEGAMYRLDYDGDVFTPVKLIDFEDAPQAIFVDNDVLYIAGFSNFFVVKNLSKEKVFPNTMWTGQYPNSVAVADERRVYVGFREGYAKLDIRDRTIRYFVYLGK